MTKQQTVASKLADLDAHRAARLFEIMPAGVSGPDSFRAMWEAERHPDVRAIDAERQRVLAEQRDALDAEQRTAAKRDRAELAALETRHADPRDDFRMTPDQIAALARHRALQASGHPHYAEQE